MSANNNMHMVFSDDNSIIESNALQPPIFTYYSMHCSAKRGIAIACRLSVCLSVCDVGGS